jgi:hypothetical protein
MDKKDLIEKLKDVAAWDAWRKENPDEKINLRVPIWRVPIWALQKSLKKAMTGFWFFRKVQVWQILTKLD